MVKLLKLNLSHRVITRLWQLNSEATALYNRLLEARQEMLAKGEKPKRERKTAVVARGNLAPSTAKAIVDSLSRQTQKGNWSQRSKEIFWPLLWKKGDFILNGKKLILGGERVLKLELPEEIKGNVRQVLLSQDWKSGEWQLRVYFRKTSVKKEVHNE